ncbi:MAG: LOG family protein [Alphaproteobacteria bacterium]|nr:LOG family protein [Alphaproteobacteria bacterium]
MTKKNLNSTSNEDLLSAFIKENNKNGIRVFVAGGSREGNNPLYIRETYNLGRKIVEMGFKLDFGLSNTGIMGAVARGVMDAWNAKRNFENPDFPIQGITTQEYFKLYDSNDDLLKHINVIFAKTLEERKQKLLDADFVVFAPGGVGTLDELAYDCVAMQDGLLEKKPFILYNIGGFFHHLLEFLKSISNKGFSDPVPFIVVDNDFELEVAFNLLKSKFSAHKDVKSVYDSSRELVYELPYFIKRRQNSRKDVIDIIREVSAIRGFGSEDEKATLESDMETAYLEKEIERMYDRLAKAGRDTSVVSYKLARLKRRKRAL